MRKSISCLFLLLALAGAGVASDDKTDRATLQGIKSVCTIVEVTGPTQAGLPFDKEHLQSNVDSRLAAAGITVEKDATTCLYLNLRPLPAMAKNKIAALGKNNKPTGLYALEVSLQFMQTVALARDPNAKTYAPTWSVSNLATAPADDLGPTAQQITVDLADQFVSAFRSVNPK